MTSLFGRLLVTASDFKTGTAEFRLIGAFPSKMPKKKLDVDYHETQDAVYFCFCNKVKNVMQH